MKANISFSGEKLENSLKPKQQFTKQALTIDEQIVLLESRGLIF
jgi:hypothetical protein